MKDFFKNLKSGMMFSGLFSLALGIVLVVMPGIVQNVLQYVLGGGLCLFGLFEIVFVFVRPNGLFSVGRMIPGILCLAVGLVFLFQIETFFAMLWVMMGIAVLIDAVYKLQYAFELKAGGISSWWISLLTSIAALVFAVVMIIKPFQAAEAMAVFAGVILAVNGLFDLATVFLMSWNAKRMKTLAVVEICDNEEETQSVLPE